MDKTIIPEILDDVSPIRRITMKLTPIAVAALVQNIVTPGTSPAEKRRCAELILAYAFGRPSTAPTIKDDETIRIVVDETVKAKIVETFDRVNQLLTQQQVSPDTKAIVEPILELEQLFEDENS